MTQFAPQKRAWGVTDLYHVALGKDASKHAPKPCTMSHRKNKNGKQSGARPMVMSNICAKTICVDELHAVQFLTRNTSTAITPTNCILLYECTSLVFCNRGALGKTSKFTQTTTIKIFIALRTNKTTIHNRLY